MTTRDRTVLMVLGIVGLVGAFWFLAIKPKKADIKSANAKISTAQDRLAAAQQTLSQAQTAKASYASDYARVVRLGKAVPVDQDVPSLVYQLQQAATHAKVSFDSVTSTGGATAATLPGATTGAAGPTGAAGATGSSSDSSSSSSSGADASQTAAATAPAGTAVGAASLMTMPFDFQFSGRFIKLQDYFGAIDRFTAMKAGGVTVRGRLLTLDSFDLSADQNGAASTGSGGTGKVSATVHATAYLAPPDELASGVPGASVPATTGAAGVASGTASSSSPTPTAATGAP